MPPLPHEFLLRFFLTNLTVTNDSNDFLFLNVVGGEKTFDDSCFFLEVGYSVIPNP